MRFPESLTLALTLGVAVGLPVEAQEPLVYIESPSSLVPALGQVEVEVTVSSPSPIQRVVFYIDNMALGEVLEAPFKMTVDAGDENVEHTFRAVAYDTFGRTGTASVSTPVFRVDEEVSYALQQLYVSVGEEGSRVLDLEVEDFTILDEGRPQELVTFAFGDIPFTAVVLVDSSTSMKGAKLDSALAGARAFFELMRPLDETRLIVFSDRIRHATPFTGFSDILSFGLGQIEAGGGTAVFDHLYLALKELEVRQGRRVVVVLSDGIDAHSVLSPRDDMMAKARHSQAIIYWLRLPSGRASSDGSFSARTSAWRSADEYRESYQLLEQTVEESGGRVEPIPSLSAIEPAFRSIVAELREQYALGYYPAEAKYDGSWRRVKVQLSRPRVKPRTRDGYLDLRR